MYTGLVRHVRTEMESVYRECGDHVETKQGVETVQAVFGMKRLLGACAGAAPRRLFRQTQEGV